MDDSPTEGPATAPDGSLEKPDPADAGLDLGWRVAAAGGFGSLLLHLADLPGAISSLEPHLRPGTLTLMAGLLIIGGLVAWGIWQRVGWALGLGASYAAVLLLALLAAAIGGPALRMEREILPQTPLALVLVIAQVVALVALLAGAALVWANRRASSEPA